MNALTKRHHGLHAALLLVGALTLAFVFSCLPREALAKSYEVGPVDFDVTVAPDGSLSVVETRTYDYRGSFRGLTWVVPQGSYEGRDISATVRSVAVADGDERASLVPGDTEEAGTYQQVDEGDHILLTLFWPAEDEQVTYRVAYELPGLALKWADTAELYWQYVPVGEDSGEEWHNVTATVHLPVPAGEAVTAGENVRAWAHGPLDGTVSFDDNDIVFFSPGVGSAEFLEARIAFPATWLTDVIATDAARLETIMAEEDQWAKDANRERTRARLVAYGIPGLLSAIGIGSFVAAKVGKKRRRARGPQAQFSDRYLRDVPTNDHPAVLGMLYHNGQPTEAEFTATLMRLASVGRLKLDAVWVDEHNKRGKNTRKRAWRMLPGRETAAGFGDGSDLRPGGKKIDDAAYRFVFKVVGNPKRHATDASLRGSGGEPYVLDSYFEESAEKKPKEYAAGYKIWETAVRNAYDQREFQVDKEYSIFPGALGLADVALAVVLAIIGILMEVPNLNLTTGFLICFIVGGLYCIMTDDDEPIPVLSQEAAEIRAQLEALRRWLCDFTRLEEAIPTDVVLWNRLLVMATVLGVADEVVKQLRKCLPEVLADERCTASSWYAPDVEYDIPIPARAIIESLDKGGSSAGSGYHSMTTASTASSHNSSSSGSGGGFSSGGGGGFSGGGGRGGAF